jgi:thymidylate synthase
MEKSFALHKGDANTLVCQSFSDCYHELNQYIITEGIKTESRLGPTYETLNFKIVIQEPIKRCTVSLNRNSNIFFHLAESLWVLSGRNDLEFIEIFNSLFPTFSDDGKTLHGAYGKRMRSWSSSNGEPLDQLFKITSLLNSDPDLRRSVISLWNPSLDLGSASKDVPCNTQLVLRVKGGDFHLTIFNRSNDLHWGYIANIFQFSFLGEIISLLLNKKYLKQTHFSQSLHVYTDNNLISKVEQSDIHMEFYSKYHPSDFTFTFENTTANFAERFSELDKVFKNVTEMVLEFYKSETNNLQDLLVSIESLKYKGKSIYEIAYLLILFISYKKELKAKSNQNNLREVFANYLIEKNQKEEFIHQDYFALALNYFVQRMNTESKLKFTITDSQMGQY